ncbi:MAG: hypothetical protein LCH53_06255 [Bacteroidetes bacterium]|nr:hypothetical protein [Bacteroidota bacterium]
MRYIATLAALWLAAEAALVHHAVGLLKALPSPGTLPEAAVRDALTGFDRVYDAATWAAWLGAAALLAVAVRAVRQGKAPRWTVWVAPVLLVAVRAVLAFHVGDFRVHVAQEQGVWSGGAPVGDVLAVGMAALVAVGAGIWAWMRTIRSTVGT